MPASGISAIQNITGTNSENISDGIFEIARLQPTSGPNALNGNVTGSATIDPSVNTFHSQPYAQRHYDITPAVNAANAQATVTLYFTQQDFDNYNNYVTANNLNLPLLPTGGADNGNVRITQFHGTFAGSSRPENYNNQNVVLIVPNVVWDNINQWWAVTFPVTGFSGFFLNTANSALPLTLLDFKGKPNDNKIMLQWLAVNEVSTKEFIIERASDGNLFSPIGSIAAQSTQNNNLYNFTDNKPLAGNNFYRLKMLDTDGRLSYSNIISINFENNITEIIVYPNPATNTINLKIISDKNESIVVKVTAASGKLLLECLITLNTGITISPINIQKLPKGLYYISALINHKQQKLSFVKH